jgi:hypothetical protein
MRGQLVTIKGSYAPGAAPGGEGEVLVSDARGSSSLGPSYSYQP